MPVSDHFYPAKIKQYSDTLRILKKKLKIVSFFRLMFFLAVSFALYRKLSHQPGGSGMLILLLLAGFVTLVKISFILGSRKRLTEKLLFVNENELAAKNGGLNDFPDGSKIDANAIYRDDLDITGHKSLYHHLNRTTTTQGADALSCLLTHPITAKETILLRQDAVRQLSLQHDISQMLIAKGLLNNDNEGAIHELTIWIETPQRLAGKAWLTIARWLLPVFNVAALFYYLDTDNPVPLGTGILLAWVFISFFFTYIMQQHGLTSKKQSILERYGDILHTFSEIEPGNAGLLKEWKTISGSAFKELKSLSTLTGLFDQRLNLLVGTILNSLFLYDLQCLALLENWKTRNKRHFQEWITCVGNIEAANSLSVFAFNHPDYCYPEIISGKPMVAAVQMAHPLMPGGQPVANDISAGQKEKLMLVTGSNMSGKSTFLRTLGVNLILAQCGSPVYARSFHFTPMEILSSIRISDSLQDNTSYFMAELKRLQQIIVNLKTGMSALVLIDEVLRGTNSDDKTHGSEAFIKKLLGYNCLSLFATHDLSLSILENSYPGEVSNYCFESVIINGELIFDYTLRQGVAKNKNASFLMEKMDII